MPTILRLLILIAAAAGLPSADAAEPLRLQGETMGTYYSIVVDSPTVDDGGESLHAAIKERLKDINRQMSTWDPKSEISLFNASDGTDWFPVSAEFAAVVQEAKRIHELTGGAFDPTVSPLIDLWGFGDRRDRAVPTDDEIAAALATVGMTFIEVRPDPPTLKKLKPTVQLNLSAIAKGYGVDAIAELIQSHGQPSFVVDIGGEARAGNAKASGEGWRIGIESPLQESPFDRRAAQQQPLSRILQLTDSSVATSGDYRNFFEVDSVRYSHTLDPTTGRPVPHPPASVSVIAESCMTADAWATAMMVLGSGKGLEVARANGLSVLFQTLTADETVREGATGEFVNAAPSPPPARSKQAKPGETESSGWIPFAAAAVLFLLAVGGMSIGVLLKNRELKGSCGGLASMPGGKGESVCDLCSVPKEDCVNEDLRRQMQAAAERE